MPIRCSLFVSASLLAAPGALVAGDLNPPPGPVAPSMKTLDEVEPRTPITSLPLTITQSGSYYLVGNLTTLGNGITVQADDVTIDLMGFTITGSDPELFHGIRVIAPQTYSNLTVRNGTVRRFASGVTAFEGSSGNGATFENLGVYEVGERGIAAGDSNALIIDCHVTAALGVEPTPFEGIGCVGGVVKNCRATGFQTGIIGNLSLVTDSIAKNGQTGILAIGGVVRGCAAYNNSSVNLTLVVGALGFENYAP